MSRNGLGEELRLSRRSNGRYLARAGELDYAGASPQMPDQEQEQEGELRLPGRFTGLHHYPGGGSFLNQVR